MACFYSAPLAWNLTGVDKHVFGSQHTSMGGKLVRTIGIVRATAKIGMQNLAYNMRRLVVLDRSALAAG